MRSQSVVYMKVELIKKLSDDRVSEKLGVTEMLCLID